MATKDSSLHLIDSHSGLEKKKLYTRSHGIGEVQYTHHESCVLLTSDVARDRKYCDIRYLCMYDNRYLRYFKGHTDKVTSISMSGCEDNFLSTSNDRTVRLWNVNTPTATTQLTLPDYVTNPVARYDGGGLVFGVQYQDSRSQSQSLKLFDARAAGRGPFQTISPEYNIVKTAVTNGMIKAGNKNPTRGQLAKMLAAPWTDFQFSSDGQNILINTKSDLLLVLDGFNESVEPVAICNRKNDTNGALGACFSESGDYVIAGTDSNDVQVMSRSTGEIVNTLSGHIAPVNAIACNPMYDVMATGCLNTVLWIHSSGDDMAE
jgi:COMPASS component SWD2